MQNEERKVFVGCQLSTGNCTVGYVPFDSVIGFPIDGSGFRRNRKEIFCFIEPVHSYEPMRVNAPYPLLNKTLVWSLTL